MIPYVALLLPIPVLMYVYDYAGIFYLVISAGLSLAWLYLTLKGFKAKDDDAWAKQNFFFSINYLTVSLIVLVLNTIHG
ncbi:Protoheme IX farnesyltransferase 2 [compost metagenome]